ncbi:MAG: hypothetical protein NT166_02845 [Candidatus Aminicenantes bacterium]|nr:hypothetical protein [Candidatus Aminicenantes bacterium]
MMNDERGLTDVETTKRQLAPSKKHFAVTDKQLALRKKLLGIVMK